MREEVGVVRYIIEASIVASESREAYDGANDNRYSAEEIVEEASRE